MGDSLDPIEGDGLRTRNSNRPRHITHPMGHLLMVSGEGV
jgi:hypothetical protein